MKFQKRKKYNPLVQVYSMKSQYPQFECRKVGRNKFIFTGELKPHHSIPSYTVEITYRGNNDPLGPMEGKLS
jgi:hypothetical protein